VPKKLFSYAAHVREDLHDAQGFGWTATDLSFDWPTLVANKDKEIHRLNGIYEQILGKAGVEILKSRATIVGPHEVQVDGRRITARHILVATGGRPLRDDVPGCNLAKISDDLFFLPELPRRVLVVGGGYIGVEFAGIFNGLGCETVLSHRSDPFLRGFDDDVRKFLAMEMMKKHIRLAFNCSVQKFEQAGQQVRVSMSDGKTADYDLAVYAIGRRPNIEGLGLEQVGVKFNTKGAIAVDAYQQTSVPSIHAIGDVTDRVNLTPVALAEGMALAKTLFGGQRTKVDYDNIPTAVFSQPPIGTVGLGEQTARERGHAVDIYKTEFRPLKHTLSGNHERTLIKLVVEQKSERVLGAHMVGIDAPEILQGIAIALKAGATKRVFDETIGIHPTAAEEFVTLREKVPEEAVPIVQGRAAE
jgi:glutathione reductase (NADPH)